MKAGIVRPMDKYEQRILAIKQVQKRHRQAAQLRAQGKTLQEIADILGVTHQRVSQYLGRTGTYVMGKRDADR